ncbi:N-acetyldiaminopimelate deacetylase [Anoxybacillus sp. BCO1]|nr:N-acetyldiaminopimelate deacetylase [Anoxybacillus sp. BCO1]
MIADRATLVGTVRTFSEQVRNDIEREIEQIVKGTCIANGCTYEYTYMRGYPPVVNHEEETKFLIATAREIEDVTDVVEIQPHMGGEDFAYYLQHVKGTFFFTGAKAETTTIAYPHHHPKFDFDERAMLIAAKTLGLTAISYMKKDEKQF